jgi:hypothetical protein
LCSPANNRWDRAVDGAERFAALVERLSARPGVTPPDESGGRKFGSTALKVGGSIFAMLTHGDVVVKLPADRVTALVADGTCAPFDSGKGRPMREWAVVVNPAADAALAEEALAFVRR